MARYEHTRVEIETTANEISLAIDRLRSNAASMRNSRMPHLLLQSATQLNLYIPEVIRWAVQSEVDETAQPQPFLLGTEPRAAIRKRHNAAQKLKAATKKPFTPKNAK